MSRFDFNDLSPDLVLDATERIGIYPESGLLALNSYENRVYQFKADDQKRYVVKFYRPERWTDAQILEEHQFCFELVASELDVLAPLQIAGNSLFVEQGYRFAMYPSVGGRHFQLDSAEQWQWLGRLLGRMHNVAEQQRFVHRPVIGVLEYLQQAHQDLRNSQLVTESMVRPLDSIVDELTDAVTQQFKPCNTLRLHGDCHIGNILLRDDRPFLVDFDDCRQGPAVQDMWLLRYGDEHEQHQQLLAMLAGYEEFREFDDRELRLVESLRAMRMVQYMAWLAKRWQDPAFAPAFPWFATENYWQQQHVSLQEQLAKVVDSGLPFTLSEY